MGQLLLERYSMVTKSPYYQKLAKSYAMISNVIAVCVAPSFIIQWMDSTYYLKNEILIHLFNPV